MAFLYFLLIKLFKPVTFKLKHTHTYVCVCAVAYPGIFFGGGSTNSVEDRKNRDPGVVVPKSGVLEAAVIWYKKFHFI